MFSRTFIFRAIDTKAAISLQARIERGLSTAPVQQVNKKFSRLLYRYLSNIYSCTLLFNLLSAVVLGQAGKIFKYRC